MAEPATAATAFDVLILGASFAGVELVYQLRRRRAGRALRLAVVDRQTEHGYIPLVQERMVDRIDPRRTRLDTRAYVESEPNARFIVGEVTRLDPARNEVTLASGERLRARFVVVALGSKLAPPPRLPGAERFVEYKFEGEFAAARAALEQLLGPQAQGPTPTIVVVGGGISGVELAGELGRLAEVRPQGWRAPKVVLVQGGERLLPDLTPRSARKATRHLARQGVELRLRTRVIELTEGTAQMRTADGEPEAVRCDLAFWTGGIRPVAALAELELPRTPMGWLQVGPTLQCFPGAEAPRPDIFAIGDAARVVGGTGEWPTMQRAIECLWQAKLCARNLLALAKHPPGYPNGIPPLEPHTLRTDFPHGVSVGSGSLMVYGRLVVDLSFFNIWFRRFLMRNYFRRYS